MDKKLFGKQLQKYRELAGYSQEDLAEKIDLSSIFISYIERGQKAPSVNTLIKLANTLNVSVDILLGKEVKGYTSEKLKEIEKRLNGLPEKEHQRLFDIIDAMITIELAYYNEQERLDANFNI